MTDGQKLAGCSRSRPLHVFKTPGGSIQYRPLGHSGLLVSQLALGTLQVGGREPLYPYWHRIVAGMDRLDPAEQPFLAAQRQTLEQRRDR